MTLKSAGWIGWGFLLMIGGWVLAFIGLMNPQHNYFVGVDTVNPLAPIGGVVSLVGLAAVAFGVHTAAKLIDWIALHLHEVATGQAPEPAKTDEAPAPTD